VRIETKSILMARILADNADLDEARAHHKDQYLIGELAALLSVEPETIRFYERADLIHPGRLGKYRVYSYSDVERLFCIRYLRRVGMAIPEIKTVFLSDEHGNAEVDTPEAGTILEHKLDELLIRRREIEDYISTLTKLVLCEHANESSDSRATNMNPG
jgi:DNA-binding transcriptional MerR regulator